jgi:hypothetical protein
MLYQSGSSAWQPQQVETMTSNLPALCGRVWNATTIRQRVSDGYVNATAMCRANGKHLPHYRANERTAQYLQALSTSVGIPTYLLIESITTGPNEQRGTWVHPRLAIDLARWISPSFAVRMDGWFLDWINNGHASKADKGMTYSELRAMSPAQQAAQWIVLGIEEYESGIQPRIFGEEFICYMASSIDNYFRQALPADRRPKRASCKLPRVSRARNR